MKRLVLPLIVAVAIASPTAAQFAPNAGTGPAPALPSELKTEIALTKQEAEAAEEKVESFTATGDAAQAQQEAARAAELRKKLAALSSRAGQFVKNGTLPVRTPEQARTFFGGDFQAVGSSALQFPGNGGALFTEFFVDNAPLGFAYGRIGFGAYVQSEQGDEEEDPGTVDEQKTEATASTFLNNGGNAALYLALPLLALNGLQTTQKVPRTDRDTTLNHFTSAFLFLPRAGLDITGLSGEIADPLFNLDTAAELRLGYGTFANVFRFFGTIRGGVVVGSPVYYERLGISDPFGHVQGTFGLDIAERLRFSVRSAFAGPRSLRDTPATLSVQVLR